MNKRLAFLEQLVDSGKADSFAMYGLAMEYKKEQRPDDALAAFERLRERDQDYVPMYLMAGQLLAERNRPADARAWLEAGLAAAKRKGDSHALSELESALADL